MLGVLILAGVNARGLLLCYNVVLGFCGLWVSIVEVCGFFFVFVSFCCFGVLFVYFLHA
jgi:hypothetical protein